MKESKLLKGAAYTSCGITILLGIAYILRNLLLGSSSKNAASIGIIGGADGPMAIFIATKIGWLSLDIFILIFGVITIILFLLKRVIKNK